MQRNNGDMIIYLIFNNYTSVLKAQPLQRISNIYIYLFGSYQSLYTGSEMAWTIRIYHEIEKSVPRITVWHQEACRVMTNGDPVGQISLSYPHTKSVFFFLLTIVFIYLFILK